MRARNSLIAAAIVLGLAQGAAANEPCSGAAKSPLEVVVDKSKVDLNEHHLELKASRDLAKVTIRVVGESGAVIADDARELASHRAGTPLVVTWRPSSDE